MDKLLYKLIIFGLLLYSCGNTDKNVKTVVKLDRLTTETKDTLIVKPYLRADEGIILEQHESFKITGDSSISSDRIYSVMIQFEPYISFDDFKVDTIYSGEKAEIDYNSNMIAKEYKTVITQTYKREGVNFAGHYCFIIWANGTSSEFAIVDVLDGKVYNIKGYEAGMGYDFRKNSRLLITNPPDSEGYYDANTAYWHPALMVWDEISKKLITKQAKIN
jgi:hypothetical protein